MSIQAAGNVGCFAGCNNPVIGQCPGYKGPCNRFYCKEHSVDRLCNDCISRALEDLAVEMTFQDYFNTAQNLKASRSTVWTILAIIGGLLGFGGCYWTVRLIDGRGSSIYLIIGLFVVGLVLLFYAEKKKQSELKMAANALEVDKPGFGKFYEAYLKWVEQKEAERSKASFANTMAILFAVGGVAYAATESYKKEQMRRDVHAISEYAKRH